MNTQNTFEDFKKALNEAQFKKCSEPGIMFSHSQGWHVGSMLTTRADDEICRLPFSPDAVQHVPKSEDEWIELSLTNGIPLEA